MGKPEQNRDIATLPEARESPEVSDLSDLEKECQRLREERDLLRLLIDHVPAYVYAKDLHSRFLVKNLAGARWLGFDSPEAALGKTPWDLYPPELAERLVADDRQVLESGQALEGHEHQVKDSTGAVRWLRTTKVPFRDHHGAVVGLVGISVDINEARLTAEELQRSEARFRDIAEVSADILWETDENLRYTMISGRYTEISGIPIESAIGKRRGEGVLDNFPLDAEERARWADHFADLEARRPFRDFEFCLPTEEKTWVLQSSGKPFFDGDGQFLGYRGISHDITEAHELRQQLIHQASRDGLTQLLNRTAFQERLRQALARAARMDSSVGLFFIDLDRFKPVNDRLGHEAGDQLLRMVAERLQHNVRDGDTVARLGGDEFALLVEDSRTRRELAEVAQKLLDLLRAPFQLKRETVTLDCSIGISRYPDDGLDPEELLRRADKAMYHAKARAGSDYRFHQPV